MKINLNRAAKLNHSLVEPAHWRQIPYGDACCQALSDYFAEWFPKVLGYQLLKIGGLSGQIQVNLPLCHQIVLTEQTARQTELQSTALLSGGDSVICAKNTALPFIQNEINACLLANTLNFAQDPHQILREVQRVLTDDGYLFLSLFNPCSPFAFKFTLGGFAFRRYMGWRIIDWLQLLNFDILDKRPVAIKKGRARFFSPLMVIVAQKRTYPLIFNLEKARSKMPLFFKPAGAFKEIKPE